MAVCPQGKKPWGNDGGSWVVCGSEGGGRGPRLQGSMGQPLGVRWIGHLKSASMARVMVMSPAS
jgi:hypothetical protein